jgi:hypothetical protein
MSDINNVGTQIQGQPIPFLARAREQIRQHQAWLQKQSNMSKQPSQKLATTQTSLHPKRSLTDTHKVYGAELAE